MVKREGKVRKWLQSCQECGLFGKRKEAKPGRLQEDTSGNGSISGPGWGLEDTHFVVNQLYLLLLYTTIYVRYMKQ